MSDCRSFLVFPSRTFLPPIFERRSSTTVPQGRGENFLTFTPGKKLNFPTSILLSELFLRLSSKLNGEEEEEAAAAASLAYHFFVLFPPWIETRWRGGMRGMPITGLFMSLGETQREGEDGDN